MKYEENNTGFDGLLNSHTEALRSNSEEIYKILEIISNKKDDLTYWDKKHMQELESRLSKMNKTLDKTLEDGKKGDDVWL